MQALLNSRKLWWLVLGLPALAMLAELAWTQSSAGDLIEASGETSARLMIAAMALAPLASLLGPQPWLRWLLARRRHIGVAAFLYTLLHLGFYIVDMGNLDDMLAELGAPGIWTGWVAFLLFVPLAATSNDAAMTALRASWKRVQRLVYPAALLTLLHWVFVHSDTVAALAHFLPLVLLLAARALKPRTPLAQG